MEIKTFEQKISKNIEEVKRTIINKPGLLSTRIATRLYRAPEVIIYEKHYFKQMDIWSAGVIMADLFKYISKPCEDPTDPQYKRRNSLQVFNGSHCFPVSPRGAKMEDDGFPTTDGHVLDSIFDILGTPSDLDLSFITDENAWVYMKKFKPRPQANLQKIFNEISPEGIHLMTQMLQFNPFLRPTVE